MARVGHQAPAFKATALVGQSFQEISLDDYKGKYLVLFFYPLDFTFVCPTELLQFNQRVKDFEAEGAQVLGVSVDSQYCHLAWINAKKDQGGLGGPLDYPLLADLTKKVSEDYGVLVPDGHSLRATFIIDGNGKVRHLSFNDDPVGRNVDEVVRLIKAFKFVDTHGEVCPANWNPGQPTFIPTQDGISGFLSKHT